MGPVLDEQHGHLRSPQQQPPGEVPAVGCGDAACDPRNVPDQCGAVRT